MEKERGVQRSKIENWTDKCNELQMLKFGRLIDLDVLEQGSDRTKEIEAENTVAVMEAEYQAEMNKLHKELNALKQQYAQVSYTLLFRCDIANTCCLCAARRLLPTHPNCNRLEISPTVSSRLRER